MQCSGSAACGEVLADETSAGLQDSCEFRDGLLLDQDVVVAAVVDPHHDPVAAVAGVDACGIEVAGIECDRDGPGILRFP